MSFSNELKRVGITSDSLYLIYMDEEDMYIKDCCGVFHKWVRPKDKDWQYRLSDIMIGDLAFRRQNNN